MKKSSYENTIFIDRCLSLSQNKSDWLIAKAEWEQKYIYVCKDMLTSCLCGHAIKHVAICRNRYNLTEIKVGSTCIKSFFGIDIMDIIKDIERVNADNMASFRKESFEYVKKKANLNDWEIMFYLDTCSKRMLSEKQLAKRIDINNKILRDCYITKEKPSNLEEKK